MKKFIKENKKAIAIGAGLGLIVGLLAVNIRYEKHISKLYELMYDLAATDIADKEVIITLSDFIISGKTPTAKQLEAAKEISELVSNKLRVVKA